MTKMKKQISYGILLIALGFYIAEVHKVTFIDLGRLVEKIHSLPAYENKTTSNNKAYASEPQPGFKHKLPRIFPRPAL